MSLNYELYCPRTNFSLQIPGHPFAPIITTSLALYLVSFFSLVKDKPSTNDRAAQSQRTSSSEFKDRNHSSLTVLSSIRLQSKIQSPTQLSLVIPRSQLC